VPNCPHVYASKYNVRRHMTYAHADFHQFECETCHKVLSSRQNYRQHQHIHTGARPFVCDICGGGYRQGSQLAIHRRKHCLETRGLPIFKLTDLLNSAQLLGETHSQGQETSTGWGKVVLPVLVETREEVKLPCLATQA